jgi:WD40 repeat protein
MCGRLKSVRRLGSLIVFVTFSAVIAETPVHDAFDDPLPPGAIARLGTTRLRHACTALAWAPDGKTFASAGTDNTVRIWEAASGKEVRQINMRGNGLNTLVYNSDGKYLIGGGADGSVRVLDAATGAMARTFPSSLQQPQQITALTIRPDGGTVTALALDGDTPRVWDFTTGKLVRQADKGTNKTPFARQALSPDGHRCAVWDKPDLLTVWDADGKELFHAPTQFMAVDGFVFSPDGKTLAASSYLSSQIVFWDVDAGKELRRHYWEPVSRSSLTFSPNGKFLAGKGGDGAVHIWGAASGKDLRRFDLPLARLIVTPCGDSPMAFSPDGKTLAAAHGVTIHLWDLEANKERYESVGHNGPVEDIRFSADGRRILTCSREEAGQWDATTSKLLNWRPQSGNGVLPPVAAADDKTVLFGQAGGVVRWDVEADTTGDPTLIAGLPASIMGLTLSANGKTLAGNTAGRFIYIWDAQNGKEKSQLKNELASNPALALTADGRLLAIGYPNMPVRLWDVAAGKEVRQFDNGVPVAPFPGAMLPVAPIARPVRPGLTRVRPDTPVAGTTNLAFSPDGKTLVGVWGSELTFWEVATGRDRMRVSRQVSASGAIKFSPDGCVIAEGTQDGSVLLLDAANGRDLTEFKGQRGFVTALAFTPDGKTIASGCADGTTLLWDIREVANRKSPTTELSQETLSASWYDLSDGDASRAYKAMLTVASSPKTAAPFLRERLAGVVAANDKRMSQLILDLDDDQFDVREKAEKELEKMGEVALPAVRQALGANPPAESRRRLQDLLDRHKESKTVTEEVRSLRALEALERSGAMEAMEALRALAKDAPNAEVKRQAQASLDRLSQRNTAH